MKLSNFIKIAEDDIKTKKNMYRIYDQLKGLIDSFELLYNGYKPTSENPEIWPEKINGVLVRDILQDITKYDSFLRAETLRILGEEHYLTEQLNYIQRYMSKLTVLFLERKAFKRFVIHTKSNE